MRAGRVGLLSDRQGLSPQTLLQARGSALHVHAPVAHVVPAATTQPSHTLPAEYPCQHEPELCGAGRYFTCPSGWDPPCFGSCLCQACSVGSFKPAHIMNLTFGDIRKRSSYRLGYYQCWPCCTCNPDGYTTASSGSVSGEACSVCMPGYGRHKQDGGVPRCVCLPCPEGTYSGKDATGSVAFARCARCVAFAICASDAEV